MKGNGRERKGKGEGSTDAEQGDPGVLAPRGCRAPASPMPAPYNPHTSPTPALGTTVPACAGTQPQHHPSRGMWHLTLRVCSRGAGKPSLQGRSLQPVSCCCHGASAASWCESLPAPRPMLLLPPLLPASHAGRSLCTPLAAQLGSHNNPPRDPSSSSPPMLHLPCLPQGCRRDGAAEP